MYIVHDGCVNYLLVLLIRPSDKKNTLYFWMNVVLPSSYKKPTYYCM